jgi:hypothetical protein
MATLRGNPLRVAGAIALAAFVGASSLAQAQGTARVERGVIQVGEEVEIVGIRPAPKTNAGAPAAPIKRFGVGPLHQRLMIFDDPLLLAPALGGVDSQ